MPFELPLMTPIFDANCAHVGWFDGTHVFDMNVEWVAYHSNGNIFTSEMTGNWLGPLLEGSFLDRQARPVAWLQGTSPHGGTIPAAPMRAMRPLRPKKPLRPRTPLFPARPLTPGCGWSDVPWLTWLGRAPAPVAAPPVEAAAPVDDLRIELVEGAAFDDFFRYLDDHLSDNGRDGAYFQPMAVAESRFPPEKAQAFVAGLHASVGTSGWRRAWVARDGAGAIVGHVDLRAHPERHTGHRCLLGTGVQRDHRRQGVGRKLLAHVEQWAASEPGLRWIDLRVISTNEAAIALYRGAGFDMQSAVRDRFEIDGKSVGEVSMAKKLAR
jgi:ribosomal protein S18 acetylase RimI-like enzyme